MAVARAAHPQAPDDKSVAVNKQALVIGGGVAGMNAALGLARQGFQVVVVEKEAELGGLARNCTIRSRAAMSRPTSMS